MICKIIPALQLAVVDYEEAVSVQKLRELESVCNKPSE